VESAVAVGGEQNCLVRGVEARECAFEVEDADVAGVGFGLAALAPSFVAESRGASAPERGAIYGPLLEAEDS
jgi:hypothetical protein